MEASDILEMNDIEKSFNGVPVLKKAHFALRKGEVHALMGGNGAGKSTLMKILTGVYHKDAGTILLDGNPVELATARQAERHGIAMIYQELSLIPTLTVAQNVFLKHESRAVGNVLINDAESGRRAKLLMEELGHPVDPRTPIEQLSVGMCQMVEVAKALAKKARILIMDEPTSSLTDAETEILFQLVNRLKRSGISIIYISHRMSEIFTVCDRVTVMRDGTSVRTDECRNVTMEGLIESMLGKGRSVAFQWQERDYQGSERPVLEVHNLSVEKGRGPVSFSIYPGEIVGLAGLLGSGRTEIAETIFGMRRAHDGTVSVNGKAIHTTREAINAGVGLVPEDRRTQGLVLDHSLLANFILPNLEFFTRGSFVRDGAGARAATDFIQRLRIKIRGPEAPVRLLSGGNQQKIVLAKWLERKPRLLMLDEPTMGVDIGAKSDILQIVRDIANGGAAVLVISSELEELLAMSDRILVIHDGKLVHDLNRKDIPSEEMLHHAIQD
ncbi:MAG: sugar ABC transporter ATP-binding protein [Verrucomicrobia bacterium]|nr:sugar ABC transporter ATP-binding protein [Verrucomicrobiota bacterium]